LLFYFISFFHLSKNIKDHGYNWIETEFYETPAIASYTVGLVISDFVCKSGSAASNFTEKIDISVCSQPNAINNAEYALDVAIGAMEFLEGYFGVAYPIDKCGQLAKIFTFLLHFFLFQLGIFITSFKSF
jgi:aminopeptidase N